MAMARARSDGLSQKDLKKIYRTVCGYKEQNGVTTDSNENTIDRYPSADVIKYVVDNAPSSATLSHQDRITIHHNAKVHLQTEMVKQLKSDASFHERSEAKKKLDSDEATLAAQKAVYESEEAAAEFQKLNEALKAAEINMRNAFLHKKSAEERASRLLQEYQRSSELSTKIQKDAAAAAQVLKTLTGT
jgi:hypothetical protein